jgi:two-component system, NarL family, sensor kinase
MSDSSSQVAAREHERRRLHQELHDDLGPMLASLTLGLDAAAYLAAGRPDLQALLGRLKAETQLATAELRRIVYARKPAALDELGLARAIREHVEWVSRQAPALRVSLDVTADCLADLPAAVEVACYRIAAEALTNVCKHAHASRCSVRIHLDRGMCVDVSDDGVGLPEGWRAGVGMASIRERVAELGGDLLIESSPPHGTRIAARLPIGSSHG